MPAVFLLLSLLLAACGGEDDRCVYRKRGCTDRHHPEQCFTGPLSCPDDDE
jgi:hypothetical protein